MVKRVRVGAVSLALVALAAAACGSSGGSGAAGSGGQTVSVHSAGDMSNVLTNADGRTLYVSDQESSGKVLCVQSDCTAIWTPVTVSAGAQPSGPSAVQGELGTVKRPDGSSQVTFNGKPLYTFSFDHAAGEVNGDGKKDSFDGIDYTWRAATSAGPATGSPSASSGGGYGGGGY